MNVVGLELNPTVVEKLNSGFSHVNDLSHDEVRTMVEAGYRASTDAALIRDADVVVICVPTPLGEAGSLTCVQ